MHPAERARHLGFGVAVICAVGYIFLAGFNHPWLFDDESTKVAAMPFFAFHLAGGAAAGGTMLSYIFCKPHDYADPDSARVLFPELIPFSICIACVLGGIILNCISGPLSAAVLGGNLFLLAYYSMLVLNVTVIAYRHFVQYLMHHPPRAAQPVEGVVTTELYIAAA